jgi:5-methylcytosine-specific restriction endonuclease McrA
MLSKPKTKLKAGTRKGVRSRDRHTIRAITGGRCHVCGGRVGRRWQADHVVAIKLGGDNGSKNFLPICKPCNRLRWHYSPRVLRMVLLIGVYAKDEILGDTRLGNQLLEMVVRRARHQERDVNWFYETTTVS